MRTGLRAQSSLLPASFLSSDVIRSAVALRVPGAAFDASSDDDWAPPKTSRYSQPKQYVNRSKENEAADSSASVPNNSIQPSPYRKPTVTSHKLTDITETQSASNDKPNVKVTDEQELDLEGALAALPENLQEIARRQLQVLRSSKTPADENVQLEPLTPSDVTLNPSKETPSVASASPVAESNADTSPSDVSSTKNKVTAKLTDKNSPASSEIVAASHNEPVTNHESSRKADASVVTAVATNADRIEPVVPASATMTKPLAASTHWKPSISDSIAKLESDIEQNSTLDENLRLSHELTLRLLYLANRQLNEAMRPIEGLEANEQDYFRHQVQALYEAGNPDAMPVKSRRWSLVMNSQRQATNELAAASNLEVRSLAFCTDVQGYGVMTKFPNHQFKPDQEILLYCELENVLAEQVKAGFETQLQGTYEIIDPNGRRVADQLLPMEREICQNHRRDYFIIYHIFMPMQIAPGNYQMRVTIEDMKARKFGQANLDFQIQK